ncbi:glycosyltransferase family 4 protein [Halopseudomonas pelagia]|uniref:glycosyltransferase family 4 protein n=1 Tax=Halopseudomonas pelagia TaxID=553151 RepID=UPI00039D1F59|nr:glycosyltransferase family 4 protein [Halopseudomonas pelagia]
MTIKGVFIHPCIRSYRGGFFSKLAESLDLDIIESDRPRSGEHVIQDRARAIKENGLAPIKRSRVSLPKVANSNASILLSLNLKYEFIIFSGFVSFPFVLLCIPAKILRKKIYVFDELWSYPSTKKYALIRPIIKYIGQKMIDGHIVAGSRSNIFSQMFFGKNMSRLTVPNTHSNYNSALKLNSSRDGDVLYLGRVVEIKGLDLLIRGIAATKDTRLTVVGEGPFLPHCKQLAIRLGVSDRVKFEGACESNMVAQYFIAHDVFVLPSRLIEQQSQQLESWGFTLNEALSYGCKIIASDMVGGGYDLIKSGFNGYMFKSEDIDDLVNKIELSRKIVTSPCQISDDLKARFNHEANAKSVVEFIGKSFE